MMPVWVLEFGGPPISACHSSFGLVIQVLLMSTVLAMPLALLQKHDGGGRTPKSVESLELTQLGTH